MPRDVEHHPQARCAGAMAASSGASGARGARRWRWSPGRRAGGRNRHDPRGRAAISSIARSPAEEGLRYAFRLPDGGEYPDPASRWQPEGVHRPSGRVFSRDARLVGRGWRGVARDELVIYELHVGTFTPEGTFDAIVPRLADLHSLGITAIELMPVAQFPGERNWGYDAVYPYAVQNSYGGPRACKGSSTPPIASGWR